MAFSIRNRRNTRIVENMQPHPTKNAIYCESAELWHHGSRTCIVTFHSDGSLYSVYIDTCGHNTASTRGKINAFLARFARQMSARVFVKRGKLGFQYFTTTGGFDTMFSAQTFGVTNYSRAA